MNASLFRLAVLSLLFLLTTMTMNADTPPPESTVTPANFPVSPASMCVGQDGNVYFIARPAGASTNFLLRMNRDGTRAFGGWVLYSAGQATANANGIIATTNQHFLRKIALYDPQLRHVGDFIKIMGNDRYEAPIHVEAGLSGDFYAADQVRDRIVRLTPDGSRVASFVIPHEPDGAPGVIRDFRVCEKTGNIYVITSDGTLRCLHVDLTGWRVAATELFRIDSHVRTDVNGYGLGGWDVGADGVLYVNDGWDGTLKRYGPTGAALPDIALDLGDLKPVNDGKWPQHGFNTLRVYKNEVLLKRANDTELFQRYDMTTGRLISVAMSTGPIAWRLAEPDVDHATAELPVPRPWRGPSSRRPLRVLFVGNSQTDAVADIPEIVEDLSHSPSAKPPVIIGDSVVIGGVGLQELWNDGLAKRKIDQGGYDWVVLQEIIFRAETNKPLFDQYARQFIAEAQAHHAKVLLFVTASTEAHKPNHQIMYDANLEIAREAHCRIAGAGMAWLKAWDARPTLDLYFTDRAHPNLEGYYLNACVLYAALTDRSPVGLDDYGLPADDAFFLQGIAWQQYADDRKAETG